MGWTGQELAEIRDNLWVGVNALELAMRDTIKPFLEYRSSLLDGREKGDQSILSRLYVRVERPRPENLPCIGWFQTVFWGGRGQRKWRQVRLNYSRSTGQMTRRQFVLAKASPEEVDFAMSTYELLVPQREIARLISEIVSHIRYIAAYMAEYGIPSHDIVQPELKCGAEIVMWAPSNFNSIRDIVVAGVDAVYEEMKALAHEASMYYRAVQKERGTKTPTEVANVWLQGNPRRGSRMPYLFWYDIHDCKVFPRGNTASKRLPLMQKTHGSAYRRITSLRALNKTGADKEEKEMVMDVEHRAGLLRALIAHSSEIIKMTNKLEELTKAQGLCER